MISAVGQLDTPIWRRRRARKGYDFIGIDETHLFNINELHVFHHFTREIGKFPISFTVDQAQAVGDRGWDDVSGFSELFEKQVEVSETQIDVTTVFRNAPNIREFCYSVLSSGATLFTNFRNTLAKSQSAFTMDDERRAQPVKYVEYPDDATMIGSTYRLAEELRNETDSTKSQVLIATLSDDILDTLRQYATNNRKPVTLLDRRGDFLKVNQAGKAGHVVLGHADYVGGLEFDVVLIVGVDKGRVPYEGASVSSNSRNFSSYTAHNRLYVAASRARYALCILGVKSRGPSVLLRAAALNRLIDGASF